METNTIQKPASPQPEEQEIDLLELAARVWADRKLVLKCCGVAVLVGLVVAFSIPKEYTTTVTLAPESAQGSASMNGLSALAGMAGINLRSGQNGGDALNPELYPDIVSSVAFSTELFDVPVQAEKDSLKCTLYEYLDEHQRAPWWSAVTGFPFKCLGWVMSLFRDEEEAGPAQGVDPFRLTPLISATLTDTVMAKLQAYITDYRTNKARHDLAFTQQLYDEARAKYYEAQQAYADYVDMNQNITLRSVQTRQERLQNEMTLAYNLYNQTAQQLQLAKAKVQESTPVFTVVQAPTVPLQASKPSKAMILIGFVFLAGVGSVGWILFGRDLLANMRREISNIKY